MVGQNGTLGGITPYKPTLQANFLRYIKIFITTTDTNIWKTIKLHNSGKDYFQNVPISPTVYPIV